MAFPQANMLGQRVGIGPEPMGPKGVLRIGFKAGDRVVVESEKVGQPERRGTVEEAGDMLRIRWDDGNESLFSPSAGSLRVLEASEQETTRDATAL